MTAGLLDFCKFKRINLVSVALFGAGNEFFQKMMSVMWLQRRDVT